MLTFAAFHDQLTRAKAQGRDPVCAVISTRTPIAQTHAQSLMGISLAFDPSLYSDQVLFFEEAHLFTRYAKQIPPPQ